MNRSETQRELKRWIKHRKRKRNSVYAEIYIISMISLVVSTLVTLMVYLIFQTYF